MPRSLLQLLAPVAVVCAALCARPADAAAQQRSIRVMGDDGQPVAYANVTLLGERPRITNERGEIEIGTAPRPALTIDVRRLGYEPFYGNVAIADTTLRAIVTLHRLSRRMLTVTVTDSTYGVPSYLRGFYERMLARQRGVGSGVYLTPEEVEKRSSGMASALLQGMNGVALQRSPSGKAIAMSSNGSCQMTILIDGHRVCPENGCDNGGGNSVAAQPPPSGTRRGRPPPPPPPRDDQFIVLDNLIGVSEIAAVEVYARGASIPSSLPTVDASCGLIAFWTGGRKAP